MKDHTTPRSSRVRASEHCVGPCTTRRSEGYVDKHFSTPYTLLEEHPKSYCYFLQRTCSTVHAKLLGKYVTRQTFDCPRRQGTRSTDPVRATSQCEHTQCGTNPVFSLLFAVLNDAAYMKDVEAFRVRYEVGGEPSAFRATSAIHRPWL